MGIMVMADFIAPAVIQAKDSLKACLLFGNIEPE